jgi:hypothetical protein
MPVGLTAQEYTFLAVSIGPAVVAVLLVYVVWRWAKRSEEAERDRE